MCTISWQPISGGFDLLFNRDEQRSRARALPVERRKAANGTAYLAPLDPAGGGTWIFANEHGLSAALLNKEPDSPALAGSTLRSRGLLMCDLAAAREADEFQRMLSDGLGRHRYAPFYIVVLVSGVSVLVREWTGIQLCKGEAVAAGMLTTSSFDTARIVASRQDQFDQFNQAGAPGELASPDRSAFHHSHDPAASAASVLMARPDARTVSITRIRTITESMSKMHYQEIVDTLPPSPGIQCALSLPLKGGVPLHV